MQSQQKAEKRVVDAVDEEEGEYYETAEGLIERRQKAQQDDGEWEYVEFFFLYPFSLLHSFFSNNYFASECECT